MTGLADGARRIAIFVSDYTVGSSPSIINSAILLARAGYWVDIIAQRTVHNELVAFDTERIKIYDVAPVVDRGAPFSAHPNLLRVLRFAAKVMRKIGSVVKPQGDHTLVEPATLEKVVSLLRSKGEYRCFVGVDPIGLIIAGKVADKFEVPLIYYSLELYLSYDHRYLTYSDTQKRLERKYHKQAIATIIQDKERADLLMADNQVPDSQPVFYAPVGHIGAYAGTGSRYFHDKFSIPYEKKIVLQLGGISEFFLSKEVAEAAGAWPDDFVLVMHGYGDPAYIDEIMSIKSGNTFLSLDMVDYGQLDELIASAYIGLAIYANVTTGIYHIGSASGKLAHYLQCGLPVITSDFPSLQSVIDRYECGVCVNHPREIAEALPLITAEYDKYHANAMRGFDARYEFSRRFQQVIDKIDSLAPGAGEA